MPSDIADASVDKRLSAVEKGINALLTGMNLMIDTVQQQTNLLAELAAAAKEEPEDSPIVGAIDNLTDAVVKMGAGLETVRSEMGGLPDRLVSALAGGEPTFDAGVRERPAP